jgi:hypothetical protein
MILRKQSKTPATNRRRCRPARRSRGLSIMELLLALAITAMLLTATAVALAASFRAYGDAVEQATSLVATRMITQRLLGLIRTSTAHGPLEPDPDADPPITLSGQTISSNYIELVDPLGRILRCEYRSASEELWLIMNPGQTSEQAQPLIGGVTAASFTLLRRLNDDGF